MENLKKVDVYLVSSKEQAYEHTPEPVICDCNKFLDYVYNMLKIGTENMDTNDMTVAGLCICQTFSNVFGIPMIITSKYLQRWWILFNSDLDEITIKKHINVDINKFVRKWKRKCIMHYLEETSSDFYVVLDLEQIEPLDNVNIIDLRKV